MKIEKFRDYVIAKEIADKFPKQLKFVEGKVYFHNRRKNLFEEMAPMGAPQPASPTNTPAPGTPPVQQPQVQPPPTQDLAVIQQMQQLLGKITNKELQDLLGQALTQISQGMQQQPPQQQQQV